MADSDIILSSKRKVNIFDRVIQTVIIMVNMNKMNRAIDEHLNTIHKLESDDEKEYHQNILREVVFVKYQYDIMQRQMYELKMNYADEVVDIINSTDKTERLKLQKLFLELEYDRVTKSKFRSKDDIKYHLLILSAVIEAVKQDIKDEGKTQRYNELVKVATDIDTKIQTGEYTEDNYKEMFQVIDDYVSYINDNYDIARLPSDERELIEFVIETMITGVQSDIDRHNYEYKLLINICKNSYRYFKILDKVFEKILNIYNESLLSDVMDVKDYMKAYKEIYDMKIKTMVNDVHRNMKVEDEYLEYSKLVANSLDEELDIFILNNALELEYLPDAVKDKLKEELKSLTKEDEEESKEVKENEEEKINTDEDIDGSKEESDSEKIIDINSEDKQSDIEKRLNLKLSSILDANEEEEKNKKVEEDEEGEIITLDKIVKKANEKLTQNENVSNEDVKEEETNIPKVAVKRRARVIDSSKK